MINSHLKDDIRYITINRANKANAITADMLDELVKIASNSNKNKAVIISGSGKVFSAGADLDEVKKNDLATSPKWELYPIQYTVCPV